MEDVKNHSEGLVDHVEALSDTFVKLVFVNITQKAVAVAAVLINTIFIYIFSFFFLLFTAIGLAWWVGDWLNSRAAGFFIVAGLFLLGVLFFIITKKKLIFPFIRNFLVRKIYEDYYKNI